MFNRERPIRVAEFLVAVWTEPLGRSGARVEDGYEEVTEFKPAREIFKGLKSTGRRLTRSEASARRRRNRIAAESRRKNHPKLPVVEKRPHVPNKP